MSESNGRVLTLAMIARELAKECLDLQWIIDFDYETSDEE